MSLPVYVYASAYASISQEYAHLKAVEPYLAEQTSERLKEFGATPIALSDKSYLSRELDQTKKAILIIPGGAFSLLDADLSKMITRIRDAVEGGWNYGGFCSGGIFACDNLTRNGQSYRFNHLSLLPVEAQVPVYSVPRTRYQGGSNNRKLVPLTCSKEKPFFAIWMEGGKLEISKDAPVKVEASYADEKISAPAAVSGIYGQGKVFVSQVHPEIPLTKEEAAEDLYANNRSEFLHRAFTFLDIPRDKSHPEFPLDETKSEDPN